MPDGAAPARTGPVAGILLAAGSSRRMGGVNKLLLEMEGETLLRRATRRALAAGLDPVIVVLGHQADRTRRELTGLACRPVVNRDHRNGIVTSIRTGLAALPASAVAATVLLADMPHVTPDMIAALVTRYRATTAPLVLSDYGGVHAPPVLYDRTLFAELAAMDDRRQGQRVIDRHRHEAESLVWSASRLGDVDTPEDAVRLVGA